jgi:hypothetical protein
MDGFIVRYALVIFIWVFLWTIFHTDRTPRAFFLYDISRLFNQCDLEISCFPFNSDNFSKCQNFYVWVPADLDQFG